MPVVQVREFVSDEPFFLVRFTGKEYPLVDMAKGTSLTLAKFLRLRSPQYYRDIEEEGKKDADEATAIIEAELSYRSGSQWIPLPTADGLIRMRYNAGYILCMSYVMNAKVPSAEEIAQMIKQPTSLNRLLHGSMHLFYNGKEPGDWLLNVLAVSPERFAHVLEKEVSRHLRRTVTVYYGPCHYYDKGNLPIHREWIPGGQLRDRDILYYFDKEETYSHEREYRFVVMIEREQQQNTRPMLDVPFSSELKNCFAYSIALRARLK